MGQLKGDQDVSVAVIIGLVDDIVDSFPINVQFMNVPISVAMPLLLNMLVFIYTLGTKYVARKHSSK